MESNRKPTKQQPKWYQFPKRFRKFQLSLSPQQNLLFGFFSYTFIGWMLLSLPFVHKIDLSFIDNLFTSTSAISTTGLVTVSISDNYTWLGQLIILLLIQIGGVGYMTFTSYLLLSKKFKLTHWHERVLHAEFAMPKELKLKDFLRSVILFTIVIETIGAVCFYVAFINEGVEHNFALWSSIFHSVSSFCTAGFSLYNDSFEQFGDNAFILSIISVLSLCGSLGFIVVTDFWNRITRKTKRITFTTKIIFGVTLVLILFGTIILYFFEPSINSLSSSRLTTAFFQCMSALTTVGFNTVSLGNFSLAALLIVIFLMYIGASPSGTGGGMKSTTLAALMAIMWNRIRNNKKVRFFGKIIPLGRLYMATSIFMLYASIIFMATFLLALSEDFSLQSILFETTSAIGTVGLGTGITSELSSFGKTIIIFVMFIGRLGLLTFGLALMAKKHPHETKIDEEDLAL